MAAGKRVFVPKNETDDREPPWTKANVAGGTLSGVAFIALFIAVFYATPISVDLYEKAGLEKPGLVVTVNAFGEALRNFFYIVEPFAVMMFCAAVYLGHKLARPAAVAGGVLLVLCVLYMGWLMTLDYTRPLPALEGSDAAVRYDSSFTCRAKRMKNRNR